METTPPPVQELSLQQRIWGVFAAPRIVFAYLDRRPRILGALLVLVVVNALVGVLVTDVAMEEQRVEIASREGSNPEQAETIMKIMPVVIPVSSAVGVVVMVFLTAAIYLFITNILLGGSTSYRHMAAALAHISMITIVAAAVRVPLILLKGTTKVQTSLAAFLPSAGDKGPVYYALAQVEIFSLWTLWLSVIAVAILAKIPPRRAAMGMVGLWLLVALIRVPLKCA